MLVNEELIIQIIRQHLDVWTAPAERCLVWVPLCSLLIKVTVRDCLFTWDQSLKMSWLTARYSSPVKRCRNEQKASPQAGA